MAIVGMRGWMRNSAIGDGITSATKALVTRFQTKAEAVAYAAKMNEEQGCVMPGSPDVFVYEALPYRRTDYIGRQNILRYQTRDCDRRIASM